METVSVLLSTYNGECFLEEQIESVLSQVGVKVHLFIRDDGSSDSTKNIVRKFAEKDPRITVFLEHNLGYTRSFFSLCRLAKNTADYYAFCDQDDVWLPDKLISAIKQLGKGNNKYKLYFSGLTLVDKDLKKLGEKQYNLQDINFGHAMIRSSVAGCTMVFNNNLNNLSISTNNINQLAGHDSWIYRLNLAIGGKTVYDSHSYIYFRRYETNTTSSGKITLKRILKEINLSREESLKYNTSRILAGEFKKYLREDNEVLVTNIATYRDSIRKKFQLLFSSKLNYSFFPVVVICKLQILFDKY
ncbi:MULTISPECIES: glycosyltransferase [Lactiplantibacillus]|uniref:glycosyltransferase n=1 Tax=Lactiplantibacillus TaxID=2767842 RepID=UPI001C1F2FB3|nr:MULTISPECIES: glycosyltransferase [Lactiplantibacillus]MBU7530826.1 glycosyltransferase [Lactiplantibacillus pentosus]MCF1426230.1 glycosyltransferase [Lactiplantibacillus plantarum]